ncbi:MAG: SpoIID/LytB domain-containing protein [Elusimicrobia bacterium]|nr:SpoIID/LytB domain-containing protein [Elusimicrobiota bacterium]
MRLLLCLLLTASAAQAAPRAAQVRVYSLYKLKSLDLEPEGPASQAAGAHLAAKASVAVHGSLVAFKGKGRSSSQKRITASGGIWLSGPALPRRLYRGELSFSAKNGRLVVINEAPLEEYIASVVSGEVSDLSDPEAYKAQAVAARTYTRMHDTNHSGEGYSLCDSTHCQLYTGSASVRAKARAAAEATRGQILTYKGVPAETYYHAICGGKTADMTSVWPFESKPYLVSVKDGPASRPYCSIAPGFLWKTKIYFTGLTRLARQAGWIVRDENATGLRITAWGPSGRAEKLEIRTQRRKVSVSATDFYHGIGRRAGWRAVRSSWFSIHQGKDYVFLDGRGSGHGVGMCQWGAEGMGRKGFTYREILKHYYPGTEIEND